MKNKSLLDNNAVNDYLCKKNIPNTDIIIAELEKHVQAYLNGLSKTKKTQTDEYDNGTCFLDIYSLKDVSSLPSWVLANIENAKIIGSMKQTIMLQDGRKYQMNNTLNHLTGAEWTYFTNSVLNTSYKTNGASSYAHHIRKIHPTPKPPQLMKAIIEFFTKEEELVFDYFMGVGGTLLGAGLCKRKAIGIDLNPIYIDSYKSAANALNLEIFPTYCGNSIEMLSDDQFMRTFLENKISLVLIDPPYSNMMSKKKTGSDVKKYGEVATPFTDSGEDLGNLPLDDFYSRLEDSIIKVVPYLKTKGHLVVFIKDLQPQKGNTNLLHAELVSRINSIKNLQYKGLRIWADQTAKLFPYGYPFSFVSNQIHQYILIFRKE